MQPYKSRNVTLAIRIYWNRVKFIFKGLIVIVDQEQVAKPTQMPLSKESQDLLKEHIRRINAFFSVT